VDFTDEQLQRYARHIVLPEVGGIGQEKLLAARVLVIGAGGLGAPLLLYLAAAGVGTLGVIDDDVVDLSNLQRQVIHATERIGTAKVESATQTVRSVNPEIDLRAHHARLDASNAMALFADYDLIADGSDNFATRFLVNDACHLAGKTLVSAAILRFEGQIATFRSHLGPDFPCYRCLYREAPPPGLVPSCSEGGVFGALAGVVGSLQAVEVLKEVLGIGETLAGHLMLYDALGADFRKIRIRREAACPLCGDAPTITDLSAHQRTEREPA
jgi:molybdopterin/thiamine biosynthesis adenylyltransferase